MRADRLLAMLLVLQAQGRMTARRLADRLEVSERTILRDVEALGAAGVPVTSTRGPSGGISLVEGYRTDLTGLTEAEAESLFAFSGVSFAADLGFKDSLEAAVRKLAASRGGASSLERMRQRIFVDSGGWGRGASVPEHLRRVQDAVWSDHRLRIRYRRAEVAVVERDVDPYGLVVKSSVWYLLGAVEGSTRVFRVSRIESTEILPETFKRPRSFDLAREWKERVGQFRGDEPRFTVKVRATEEALPLARRVLGSRIVSVTARGFITMEFPALEAARASLAGFGASLEVISPPALRLEMARVARELLGVYQKQPKSRARAPS
jgi:predicted DNA-binding transcriptional regulator YafY